MDMPGRSVYLAGIMFLAFHAPAQAGTWGYGSFENDSALDWVENFFKPDPVGSVEVAVSAITKSKRYLQANECCYAIAACEALAAARGKAAPTLPADRLAKAKYISAKKSSTILPAARLALARILDDSELRELWEESSNHVKWRTAVLDLKERLNP